jgi:cobalt/nickel transport system permease protein
MHIPDGYMGPATYAGFWAATVAAWTYASRRVKQQLSASQVPFLAIASAFSFVVMIFTIPLPGGTTAHVTGATLIAILLGPWQAVIATSVALVIQSLVFGDGGITAIGANCFNIAVAGPLIGYGIYRTIVAAGSTLRTGRSPGAANPAPPSLPLRLAAAAVGSYAGINAAALLTAFALGIQPLLYPPAAGASGYFPFPLSVVLPAIMIPHLTVVGGIEAAVSVLVLLFLMKSQPRLAELGHGLLALAVVTAVLASTGSASAHEFWIEQKGRDFVLIYGHGTHREDFDPGKVKTVKAFDGRGKIVDLKKEKKEKALFLSTAETPAVVVVEIDNGYWSKTIYGWKNLPKRQASRVVEALRSFNYSSTLVSWGENAPMLLSGTGLAIVPLKNPFDMKAGDSLAFKVSYQGKPLLGARVEGADHDTVATTDKDGVAQVKLSKGHNVITLTHKEPLRNDPEADFLSVTATLSFEVRR